MSFATVKFWGTRGSYVCNSPEYHHVGGHTSCVTVEWHDQIIILDAGTGIQDLGKAWDTLDSSFSNHKATLCLSHGHMDHISGLPFFKPIWDPNFELTIIAGPLDSYTNIHSFLEQTIFASPLHPVPLAALKATIKYVDLTPTHGFDLTRTMRLSTCVLNHPGGSMGYKIEQNNKAICYITDHEHSDDHRQDHLESFVQHADLMIYDATFTDAEYPMHQGWGHSTWQEAVNLAKRANVKRLALFHHAPTHTDKDMIAIERAAQVLLPSTFVARQGQMLHI